MGATVRIDDFQSNKDEILARVSTPEIIGGLISLVKRGSTYEGLCPFHQEKTPSFRVYADNYHCFGCGQHGDTVDFVRKHLGLSFPDAMRWISFKVGMEYKVMRDNDPVRSVVSAEHKLLTDVQAEYKRNLSACAEAKEYLDRRGISAQVCDQLGLGYAAGRKNLSGLGRDSGPLLRKLGLVKDDGRGHERELFFGRIMFPIFTPVSNRFFELKGFAGRVMGDACPKYLNSPESEWFKKGATLFGWDAESMAAIRREGVAIVVEGFLDVVQCRQQGIMNVLACMGTAVTKEQLELLFSRTDRIIIALDGDEAGYRGLQKAAVTALPLMNCERDIGFVRLQGGDPDEILRASGAQELLLQMKNNCADVIEMALVGWLSEIDSTTMFGKRLMVMKRLRMLLEGGADGMFCELALDRARELLVKLGAG